MIMTLWIADHPLVLASKSRIRRAILENAGVAVEVSPADIDERAFEVGAASQDPGEVAALLAREKARVVARHMPGRLALGADQTLALGEWRFSKPGDRAAARDQLNALRGQTHELHTAIAFARDGTVLFEHRAVARLTMRMFSDEFREAYLDASGEAVTVSVGGYQVEGVGSQLFDRIEGDHYTILGLSLLPVLDYLRHAQALAE
jgi:septum formation protein